jgi:hypothetical protein
LRQSCRDIEGQFNRVTVVKFMNDYAARAYRDMLVKNVRSEIERQLNEFIGLRTNISRTRLTESKAQEFTNQVFKKWPDMGRDAREFYRQNVAILADKKSGFLHGTAGTRDQSAGWVRLSDQDIDEIFSKSYNPQDLRVNLLKRRDGEGVGKVLFGTNLPDVPEKTNVWYSRPNGLFGVVQHPGKDFLRKLYEQFYESGSVASIPNEQPEKLSKGPFDLNMAKFNQNFLKSNEQKVQTPGSVQHDDSDLFAGYPILKGSQAVDMAYNRTWTFDAQQGEYFRMENGRKVYYNDQAKGDASTCYANYLGKDGNCQRVIDCLYSSDPSSLSRCMDVLDSADMWTVAKEDALKVGPEMVRVVLTRFGVQGRNDMTDSNGVTIKVPMPYDEWMRDVVSKFPDNVRDTIKKNTKLTDYIKGLINACRSNPSILNENNPSVVAREDIPQFAKDLSLQKYLLPEVNQGNVLKLFSSSLEHASMPRGVNNDLWNVFLSGNMSNVGFFSPYADQYSNIMGGGFYKQQGGGLIGTLAVTPGLPSTGASNMNVARNVRLGKAQTSSNMFNSLFAVLTRAMADVGVQIHSEDMDRIRGAIAKINQYEQELGKLCDILQNLVKLARFHGISLENIDKNNIKVVKLSKLNDMDDVKNFVQCYVKEITRNMADNMSIQQHTGYELMSKLVPRFCDSASGDDLKSKCDSFSGSRDLVPL